MSTRNTIVLTSLYGRLAEFTAGGTVQPGDLCVRGSAGTVTVHATEGGYAERMFAVEDALQGNDLADSYSSASKMSVYFALPGDEINAFIKSGESIVIGDELVSKGDGTLIKDSGVSSGVTVKQVIAIATETLDLSASGAVDTRSKVSVI